VASSSSDTAEGPLFLDGLKEYILLFQSIEK